MIKKKKSYSLTSLYKKDGSSSKVNPLQLGSSGSTSSSGVSPTSSSGSLLKQQLPLPLPPPSPTNTTSSGGGVSPSSYLTSSSASCSPRYIIPKQVLIEADESQYIQYKGGRDTLTSSSSVNVIITKPKKKKKKVKVPELKPITSKDAIEDFIESPRYSNVYIAYEDGILHKLQPLYDEDPLKSSQFCYLCLGDECNNKDLSITTEVTGKRGITYKDELFHFPVYRKMVIGQSCLEDINRMKQEVINNLHTEPYVVLMNSDVYYHYMSCTI